MIRSRKRGRRPRSNSRRCDHGGRPRQDATGRPTMPFSIAALLTFSPFDTGTLIAAMTDHLQIAQRRYAAGAYGDASTHARLALGQDPDSAAAWRTLGLACVGARDFDDAVDALENASLRRPLDNAACIELAIAYGRLNRTSLSRDLLMSSATSGRLTVNEMLRVAGGLESLNEPMLAMQACREARKIEPNNAEVYYRMGHYVQLCGHPCSLGESLIRHAVSLEPNNIHYRIGLASLLTALGRKCEAYSVVDPMIPSKLDDVTCECCLKRLANLCFDCDDQQGARQCAERLTERSQQTPQTPRPHAAEF